METRLKSYLSWTTRIKVWYDTKRRRERYTVVPQNIAGFVASVCWCSAAATHPEAPHSDHGSRSTTQQSTVKLSWPAFCVEQAAAALQTTNSRSTFSSISSNGRIQHMDAITWVLSQHVNAIVTAPPPLLLCFPMPSRSLLKSTLSSQYYY